MKNIFAGAGSRAQFVHLIYNELKKRQFVSLADVLCVYYGREKGYYEKFACNREAGYGELKKAFPSLCENRLKTFFSSKFTNI